MLMQALIKKCFSTLSNMNHKQGTLFNFLNISSTSQKITTKQEFHQQKIKNQLSGTATMNI